jgi:hypothetical protein
MTSRAISEKLSATQAGSRPPAPMRPAPAVRAELRRLQARYDSGSIPPAIFSVVRKLEVELAWIEHEKPSRTWGPR